MSYDALNELLREQITRWQQADLLRNCRTVRMIDAVHVEAAGRRLVNFSSNNYLGLSHHPDVVGAAKRALDESGAGSGASPLITGYSPEHAAAEQSIAGWKGTEGAKMLPSGYQAAHAAVQTLAKVGEVGGGVRFLIDKLAHASLIDAVRGTGMPLRVFPHNNLAKLRRLLGEIPAGQLQVVVSESIFSMDGDAADLTGLAQLKGERPFVLLLDEAHASGVYGPGGAGLAAELGLQGAVDVSIVTLSKALGVVGGAVCGSADFCRAIANCGRAYVYSTSVPAATVAAAAAAIDLLGREPWRQERVRALARRLREALAGRWVCPGRQDAPIVPIILGEERVALDAARGLEEKGLLVVAVRPPTVPRGTSRLRVTLSAEHSDHEVGRLAEALGAL